jgi:hypothetical protein
MSKLLNTNGSMPLCVFAARLQMLLGGLYVVLRLKRTVSSMGHVTMLQVVTIVRHPVLFFPSAVHSQPFPMDLVV